MSAALVILRLHRWGLGAVAVISLLLAAVCGWLAMDVSNGIAACLADPAGVGCQELETSGTLRAQDVVKVVGVLGFLPFIGGALLGAPLVAREVEQRTASLAWPLSISRTRWMFRTALPVIGIGTILVALPAAVGMALVSSYAPAMDPWSTFEHFGLYGPALVVRFLAVTSVGLIAGIWLGKTLPALIASAAGAVALYFVLNATYSLWLPPVQLPDVEEPADSLGRLFVRQMVRMPDGTLVPIDEALAVDPSLEEATGSVEFGLPADRAPEVALREYGALLAGTALLVVVGIRVVRRRRPY